MAIQISIFFFFSLSYLSSPLLRFLCLCGALVLSWRRLGCLIWTPPKLFSPQAPTESDLKVTTKTSKVPPLAITNSNSTPDPSRYHPTHLYLLIWFLEVRHMVLIYSVNRPRNAAGEPSLFLSSASRVNPMRNRGPVPILGCWTSTRNPEHDQRETKACMGF